MPGRFSVPVSQGQSSVRLVGIISAMRVCKSLIMKLAIVLSRLFLGLGILSPMAEAGVLLHDDFSGSSLDSSLWSVASWSLGRTQFGSTPTVANGSAWLTLQTYNPQAPGQSLLGTEIYSNEAFAQGSGLEITARVRLHGVADGAVAALFSYTNDAAGATDEIDVEMLTKQLNHPSPQGPTVSFTNWSHWQPSDGYDNGPRHANVTPTVPGLDVGSYNNFTIRWLPGETQWWLDGQEIAHESLAVPSSPMPVHLNFWAPAATWSDAFSAGLQPTADPAANQTYVFEVSEVTVQTVPELSSPLMLVIGLVLMGFAARQGRTKPHRRHLQLG